MPTRLERVMVTLDEDTSLALAAYQRATGCPRATLVRRVLQGLANHIHEAAIAFEDEAAKVWEQGAN